MCFWIFHDWRLAKAWEGIDVFEGQKYLEIAIEGYQCRKCKKRKIENKVCGPCVDAVQQAIEWLNEEE